MLRIAVQGDELYNEETEEFLTLPNFVVELEHSLVSLSKWESKFEKPFLGPGEKTRDEVLHYIMCMILTKEVPDLILTKLYSVHMSEINDYIDSKQSATTFGQMPGEGRKGPPEVVTSELIYFWLVNYNIPFDCETWNLNRLFALIKICNVKNGKKKKMSRREVAQRNRELNAQRKAKLGTNG